MNHYPQFAVLRGGAAIWVYIGHALMVSGFSLWFVPSGRLAVDLFMILSGFVITLLRINKVENYSVYIFRRFMRIYPLFLVALALGYMTMHLYLPVLGENPLFSGDTQKFIDRDASVDQFFYGHLFAHLTLLHGAIPDSMLPQSALAISGPLWSISLEWQFYILAPFIIWGLDYRDSKFIRPAITILLIYIIVLISHKFWTPSIVTAFLPEKIDLFMLGVLCGIAWESSIKKHYLLLLIGSILSIFVYKFLFHNNLLPLVIWFFTYIVAATGDKLRITILINRIFSLRPAVWIGERSYGLYVLHMPVMLVVSYFIAIPHAHELTKSGTFLTVIAITTPIVLIFTALSYKYIEMPAIKWAKNSKLNFLQKSVSQ